MASLHDVESLGGIPVLSVLGTPRATGERIGHQLKDQLHRLSQLLLAQLAASAQTIGTDLTPAALREHLRSNILPAAKLEPSLWMEVESMARAADLPCEDLLLVHGFGDLLSFYGCPVPPARSSFVALAAPHTADHQPRLVYAWHLDPELLPFVTLLHRTPSHGPASLTLTLAGLHPVAGVSEAGIATCLNELRVLDGAPGHFTTHQIASALTAPSFDDALRRVQAGPRQGGAALHLITASGRATVEVSGQQSARLADPQPQAPRVHTNHALDEGILQWSAGVGDFTSLARLAHLARLAVDADGLKPQAIQTWFGFPAGASPAPLPAEGMDTTCTVLLIADPAARTLMLRRGDRATRLEAMDL